MTLALPYPYLDTPELQANFETIAMQFPTAAANLVDKAATARKVKLDVVSLAVTGNNGYVINTPNWSNLFWLDYTTPSTTMQGIVLWSMLVNDQVAAWHWSRGGLQVLLATPTLTIAPWSMLNTLGGAGNPLYAQHQGWGYFQLAASTTYRFVVTGQAGTVNTMLWVPSGGEANAMTGVFWAL